MSSTGLRWGTWTANKKTSSHANQPYVVRLTHTMCVRIPNRIDSGHTLRLHYRGAMAAPTPQHVFLAALGVTLTGYAFLGKGFAYLPDKPVFVGELVLALGLFTAVMGGKIRLALRSPVSWLLIAFAVDGALRTIPYVSGYGLDAIRDAVIWGYGAFAILVAAFVLQLGCIRPLVDRYRRWIPWLLLWIPTASLIRYLAHGSLPIVNQSPPVTLLDLKSGDVAVQLAGAGSFMALGLARAGWKKAWGWRWWALLMIGIATASFRSRGGMLAFLSACLIVTFCHGFRGWGKLTLLAAVALMALYVFNFSFNLGGYRSISVHQLTLNMESLVGTAAHNSAVMETRSWRLEWLKEIIDYSMFGPYFWTGKGFGINLADDDGFQVAQDDSLRGPHDANATILARMGVPGLAIWILLQSVFGLSLLRAHFRSRACGQEWWSKVDLWILAFWLAFMVNGTFDVFLEGPQGGIWFWSLFGLGIAALEIQKQGLVNPATSQGGITNPLRGSVLVRPL